jgi:hypothetical protein
MAERGLLASKWVLYAGVHWSCFRPPSSLIDVEPTTHTLSPLMKRQSLKYQLRAKARPENKTTYCSYFQAFYTYKKSS